MTVDYEKYTEFVDAVTSDESKTYSAFDKRVYELEERLADYVGSKYCISCSSGTDALLISLMAMGIGPGHAIITTPFTYIATVEVTFDPAW